MTDSEKQARNQIVISYLTQRKAIGVCGMLLPLILALLPYRTTDYMLNLEPSISDYFYTYKGDILVVLMSVLGVFLITYKGYTKAEKWLTNLAAIGALGVAFIPTKSKCSACANSVHSGAGGLFGNHLGEAWHLSCAALFLLSSAVLSIHFFTKTNAFSKRSSEGQLTLKAKRNIIYKVCGWVMVGSIGILGIYFVTDAFHPLDLKPFPIIYTFEFIAVEAFGFSWLTKGEAILSDK